MLTFGSISNRLLVQKFLGIAEGYLLELVGTCGVPRQDKPACRVAWLLRAMKLISSSSLNADRTVSLLLPWPLAFSKANMLRTRGA